MNYKIVKNGILLIQKDLNLDETLDCGQAFRWTKTEENTYCGYFLDKFLKISQTGEDNFFLYDTTEDDFLNIWSNYFDLDTDYGELKKVFSLDITLKNACEYASGIRLLRQNSWESLCSFIISQNNNIPRIKGIISRMCEKYNGFPDASSLAIETPDTLAYLRAGFRAKYIVDAASNVSSGKINLEEIKNMDKESARKTLMTIKGVGPKVADCVLLYGMHRTDVYPVDVWIRRVMEKFYPDGMPECTKGYEGIAQQYLFHYIRNNYKNL